MEDFKNFQYIITLYCIDKVELDELVQTIFHESAHIYLGHFDKIKTSTMRPNMKMRQPNLRKSGLLNTKIIGEKLATNFDRRESEGDIVVSVT